jgi:hypothetical protein
MRTAFSALVCNAFSSGKRSYMDLKDEITDIFSLAISVPKYCLIIHKNSYGEPAGDIVKLQYFDILKLL